MPTPIKPTRGRIKGAPLRAFMDFLAQERGVDLLRESVRGAQQTHRDPAIYADAPGFGMLDSIWYDAVTTGLLLDGVLAGVHPDVQRALAKRAATQVMAKTLRGVHQALFRVVGSPALMRRYRMTFWHKQYDTGEVDITDLDEHAQLHVYREWYAHHPFTCHLTFACLEPMFTGMGLSGCKVEHQRCVVDGHSEDCAAIIRWRG